LDVSYVPSLDEKIIKSVETAIIALDRYIFQCNIHEPASGSSRQSKKNNKNPFTLISNEINGWNRDLPINLENKAFDSNFIPQLDHSYCSL